MENIYTMIDAEKKRIEQENISYEQEQASDDLTFLFSSKPKMITVKQEVLRSVFG
jgi:hypothetical protein